MSCSVTDPRLVFRATYFDAQSHTTKEFLVLFYHGDSTVELIDAAHGKTFLKRTACPNLTKAQFFIGANIVVFGRVLHLTHYADKVTEQLSEKTSESAIVLLGQSLFSRAGDCLDIVIRECGFSVCSMSSLFLRDGDKDASVAPHLINQRVLILHLVRDKALAKAADLPSRFGSRDCWVSATKADVEIAKPLTRVAENRPCADLSTPSTVVIIKPHVLCEKRGGEALQILLASVRSSTLLCASQVTMSTSQADAFLQSYKGILKDYRQSIEELASSACWVVQLSGSDSIVREVRNAIGPFDPVIAKVLRPKTLRAKLGADCARNGFHCSDLELDGPVDAAFFWGH